MTENAMQFSTKDTLGNIAVIGGTDFNDFMLNLNALFEGDMESMGIVLSRMRGILTGGPGSTEEAVRNFTNAGLNPTPVNPPAADNQWAGMPPTTPAPPAANNWANMNQPAGNWGGQQQQAAQPNYGQQRQSSGPPPGMPIPMCNHNIPRGWKEGSGANGAYRGWVCQVDRNTPGGQCKAQWLKD